MQIVFRTLGIDDIYAYREIRLDCLQNHPNNFGTLLENEVNSKALKFDNILKKESSSSFLYGAFKKGKLIGICGFIREERVKTNHRGTISQMYVRDEFAGQGIGTKILKNTLDKAFADETLEIIDLGVVSNNERAIKLYADFRFKPFGQFRKYFKYQNNYRAMIFMVLSRENYFEIREI